MSKSGRQSKYSSGSRGGPRNQGSIPQVGDRGKEVLGNLGENSEVLKNFKIYSQELDKRHDKFERLVKLSRDITIESKRIIFLLHTIDRESKKASVLEEAKSRLEALVAKQWRAVARELENEDHYLYHRAFSPGMQEFMEAFIFCDYLMEDKFPHWDVYQNKLMYSGVDHPDDGSNKLSECQGETSVKLVPSDYILGLADVTGELMRKCINNLGEGDVEGCYKTCNFVRNLYSGFLTVVRYGLKEMSRKAFVLRQSLLKMEMVCYNIHVRGKEIPRYMLADVDVQKTYTEEDEGFFG